MNRFAFLIAALAFLAPPLSATERAVSLPAPAYDPAPAAEGEQKLIVAGGCFWGVQGVFQRIKGVTRAVSGYAGGARRPRTTIRSRAAIQDMPNRSRSPMIQKW